MRRRILFIVLWLARPLSAQAPDSARPPGALVAGVVVDSISRLPLARAAVQLVATDHPARYGRTEVADSAGRFALAGVPAGRYLIAFFHPMLDSLGLEPPVRELEVAGDGATRADLAIPSPDRLRRAVCGARGGAVVLGSVRDAATGLPVAGATVTGTWMELSIAGRKVTSRVPRVESGTAPSGWFALCGVPATGVVVLQASLGADSTDRDEVTVEDGLARRELYLGAARSDRPAAEADLASGAGARAAPPATRPRRRGAGRIGGSVVAAATLRPVAGALVSLANGPEVRTNEAGEWVITDAPEGTRMLEVRAIGFHPVRRRADVVRGAPPLHVALLPLEAVLDTVRVRAGGPRRAPTGFSERRRAGAGTFLGPEDIARREVIGTSELLRTVGPLRLEATRTRIGSRIVMRGISGFCSPSVYLDGAHIGGIVEPGAPAFEFTSEDVDLWIRPEDIAGIEVYVEGTVPPQFQPGIGNCGVILIWSRGREQGQ